jgi:SAM-dependent methyltransferase
MSARRDRELEVGSLAHYEDPAYYTATYARRIEDVAFYVALAQRTGGPVLEYGVGNGRIALPIARHGIDVVGVDHSKPMLGALRARLTEEPTVVRRRVRVVRGDMRRVKLRRRFPLVLCTFNTALHLYSREDVERFLARVREHLAPRGRFVVDLSVPRAADLARDGSKPFHAPRFRHPTAGVVVTNREHFDYDPIRQVLFVSMEFEPFAPAPRPQEERGRPNAQAKPRLTAGGWVTPLAHRQFFPQEWAALLHYNGFRVERVEGDFHGGPLTRDSDVMVWHARRRAARSSGSR